MSRSLCCFMVLVRASLHLGNSAKTSWPGILQRGQGLPLWFSSRSGPCAVSIFGFRDSGCDWSVKDTAVYEYIIGRFSLWPMTGFCSILHSGEIYGGTLL